MLLFCWWVKWRRWYKKDVSKFRNRGMYNLPFYSSMFSPRDVSLTFPCRQDEKETEGGRKHATGRLMTGWLSLPQVFQFWLKHFVSISQPLREQPTVLTHTSLKPYSENPSYFYFSRAKTIRARKKINQWRFWVSSTIFHHTHTHTHTRASASTC